LARLLRGEPPWRGCGCCAANSLGAAAARRTALARLRRGEQPGRGTVAVRPGAQLVGDVRDLVRLAVGREHELLVVLVERVERVEELVLRALFGGEELDVVLRNAFARRRGATRTGKRTFSG
jgi:hypothetical protein